MRKYRVNASASLRVEYGVELVAGLRLFPETAPHGDSFEKLTDELDAAYEARRAARKPLLKKRAALRFANYQTDQVIRQCSKAAEIADGGRRGPIFEAAFPEGLTPVIAPNGARQIPPTEALISRISKSKAAGVDAFGQEWLPKLTASLAALQAAADAHTAAHKAYVDAFGTELALRKEHYLTLDRVMGHVRVAFPRDTAKQDLIFPPVDAAEETGDEEAEGGEQAEAAPAEAAKAKTPKEPVTPESNSDTVPKPAEPVPA